MTPEQHNELLIELRAIRAALESKPKAATVAAKASTGPMITALPAPETIIENAGEVAVHFGKNSGTPISSLNDKQLLWYGADREPQLKNDGTPFPPREADTLLKNACRTLWHQRNGGLAAKAVVAAVAASIDDEQVPF